MEKEFTLIIVDFQKDFCSPSGSLYVKGSEKAKWNIYSFLCEHIPTRVIFTVDWHPSTHCSFELNGGEWPKHCVQYSEGSSISPLLLGGCIGMGIPYTVIKKGEVEEEYGAFNEIREKNGTYTCCTNTDSVKINSNENLAICGLAGDYCVLETIKNLKPIWHNLSVFPPGIASIDEGKELDKFIKENSLNIITE